MGIIWAVLKVVIIIIGALIGLFILELAVVAFIPGFKAPPQMLTGKKRKTEPEVAEPIGTKKDVSFEVKGKALSAWLFLPENISARVPCIVMGHGLGGTKDMGLQVYARHFQRAGFAVLAFDFRFLGKSEGEPRQLVWIPYQLEDYAAAVAYARNLEEIDPDKIALWGTSLSGGHVIVTAAKDNRIACVSAQVPLLHGSAGGHEVLKAIGLRHLLKVVAHGQRDMVRSWFGLSPHKIPIVGKPKSIAVLAFTEAYEALEELAPENFINEVCARIAIRMDKYRPIKHISKIQCPVLLLVCDKDIGIPQSLVAEAEKRLGNLAEVIHYPIDHFDIYLGDNFRRSVNDQVAFFKKHLLG